MDITVLIQTKRYRVPTIRLMQVDPATDLRKIADRTLAESDDYECVEIWVDSGLAIAVKGVAKPLFSLEVAECEPSAAPA